jgi:hypothetical protein
MSDLSQLWYTGHFGDKLTAMNVAGRKNRVTVVMTRIDTVSCSVFFAMPCIARVIVSMRVADTCARFAKCSFALTPRYWRMPLSWKNMSASQDIHIESTSLTKPFRFDTKRSKVSVLDCIVEKSFSTPHTHLLNRLRSASQSEIRSEGNST